MGQRITIVLADDLIIRLRNLQAKQIRKTKKTASFSGVLNQQLRKRMKTNGK